jgi:hypothetical protein
MMLAIGYVAWGLTLYNYGYPIAASLLYLGLAVGFGIGRDEIWPLEKDPTAPLGGYPLVVTAIILLGPPVVLYGLARVTRPRERPLIGRAPSRLREVHGGPQ